MDILRGLFVVTVALTRLLVWITVKLAKASYWLTVRLLRMRRSTTFGSAKWAGFFALVFGGALGRRGLIVGKIWGRLLRFNGDGALLVYAPQGSGKGVGIVIPNCLEARGSLIVTDPKGENAAITGRYRATLGPVYRLNVGNPALSDQFNPLSLVRRGTDFAAEDVAMIADLLVTPESHDAHWDVSARHLIAAVLSYILHSQPRELQTLAMARDLIAAEPEVLKRTFERMANTGVSTIAEEARSLLGSMETEEFVSVRKNAAKALNIWSRDRIGGRLSARSDFELMDLHQQIMTVYVIVPEDMLEVYKPFLRVVMGCALAAMVRAKALPRPRHKPLLIFDECATLGRLDALVRGMGYLREYARTILVFQDLGQVRQHYGEDGARTFVANSGAQVAFGVNDTTTARELAETIGMTTVRARSEGLSQANTDLYRAQQQAGASEAGRALLDASEVRRIRRNQALVFLSTVAAPIRAKKVRYFKVWRWRGRWDRWRHTAEIVPLPLPSSARRSAA